VAVNDNKVYLYGVSESDVVNWIKIAVEDKNLRPSEKKKKIQSILNRMV
jgi:hypothetical protein